MIQMRIMLTFELADHFSLACSLWPTLFVQLELCLA